MVEDEEEEERGSRGTRAGGKGEWGLREELDARGRGGRDHRRRRRAHGGALHGLVDRHDTRKRRYSEDGDKSNSASPAPEDRRTAYERFKNLSFSKKNPFADGGAREVRDYRNARYRNEREGAGRYRRDERDDENRRRDRRFDRDRNDRRDVDDNFRRNNGSGKDGPERDQRRGYNSVNSDGYPAPSQPNIGFGMLPNSLWERIDMFVHSQENQLSNLTDENICDKLVELLELRQEQTRFIKRREKQLEDLHNSIENEHEEIEKLKQDLPPEFFTNQNGGGDSHFDNLSNAPHDGGYGVRTYPPPMDVPLPTGQYTSMPPNMPPNLNGIRGFQPNVPPPNLPPLHVMPPTVFTNPPPTFDVARPPPPLPADLGCMPIPHHLLPHSMKNPTSSAGPSIPLVPDFSVPPPGFPPVAIRANSPGMNQDRFQSAPVYGNDRFARNNEPYNRDRFVGDRLPAPAPTPLRNVVPGMHNPNNQPLSSSWSQPASNDNDSSNRSSREAASASPTLINSVEANFMIEENHEPVSGPGSPNSGMSAVSDDCFNGPSSQADQEQSAQPDETYDVVSDDEDGSHMI
ncbi:hypothetical protein L596_004007 [Steinernema carpocapsae]|uniref:Uncharacterized protein n=1 Tax=Steinernema carpocapsae TaxID=34508 RepID=A0A4U8UUH2_STECR|nr:hypothetical protein L596_004007 [Steinernema carpocapsae]